MHSISSATDMRLVHSLVVMCPFELAHPENNILLRKLQRALTVAVAYIFAWPATEPRFLGYSLFPRRRVRCLGTQ